MGARRPSIAQRVAAIRDDRTHGAGYLAQEAVRTLALAAEEAQAPEVGAVLQGIAQELLCLRPGMAPIKNAVLAFLRRFSEGGATPSHARATGQAVIDHLVQAGAEAAQQAACSMPEGATVATCSYSATVVRALILAHQQDTGLRVLALRSRGFGGQMANELVSSGVGTTVIDDGALEEAVPQCTVALVGADRLLPSGAIINGSPTLLLARVCQKAGRPFYVVCDTFKLDEGEEREPGLDLVPPELVTGVFTEKGFHEPHEVGSLFG